MTGKLLLYPFLLAIYPVLFLFSINLEDVFFPQLVGPLLACLGMVGVLMPLGKMLFGTFEKSAVVTSAFVVLFFSYGRLVTAVHAGSWFAIMQPIWRHLALACVFFLAPLLIVGVLVKRTPRLPPQLTSWLNIASILLVAGTLVPIAGDLIGQGGREAQRARPPLEPPAYHAKTHGNTTKSAPDIYYIILDGYGANPVLTKFYGHSNDSFLNALRARGFYVADDSCSNYPDTLWSLASSLNMQFVHNTSLSRQPGEVRRLRHLIQDNEVVRNLRQKGYRYVHFSSVDFGPTEHNPFADINIGQPGIAEFTKVLLRSTLLAPIAPIVGADLHRESILHALEEAPQAAKLEQPVFALVHLMVPHPPYFFNRDGSSDSFWVSIVKQGVKSADSYVDQVVFINKKMIDLIDQIKGNARHPPVIVIQGDHGPRPQWRGYTTPLDRRNREDLQRQIDEKLGILNAYHLPPGAGEALYDSITPVNSFRVIFQTVFDEKWGLLEDVSYLQDDEGLLRIEAAECPTRETGKLRTRTNDNLSPPVSPRIRREPTM